MVKLGKLLNSTNTVLICSNAKKFTSCFYFKSRPFFITATDFSFPRKENDSYIALLWPWATFPELHILLKTLSFCNWHDSPPAGPDFKQENYSFLDDFRSTHAQAHCFLFLFSSLYPLFFFISAQLLWRRTVAPARRAAAVSWNVANVAIINIPYSRTRRLQFIVVVLVKSKLYRVHLYCSQARLMYRRRLTIAAMKWSDRVQYRGNPFTYSRKLWKTLKYNVTKFFH